MGEGAMRFVQGTSEVMEGGQSRRGQDDRGDGHHAAHQDEAQLQSVHSIPSVTRLPLAGRAGPAALRPSIARGLPLSRMCRWPLEVWLTDERLVKASRKFFSEYNTSMRPVCILLIMAALSLGAPAARAELILISTDREVRMGASIAKQIAASKEFTISNDPALVERMDRIGQKLAAVSDRQDVTYHFTLLEWDEVNAFALPGGFIYLSTKLMTLSQNDDELASVLGHEIGHVVARHAVKRLQASLGATFLQALTMLGSRDRDVVQGTQIALGQLFLAHSRQDELEADTLSVKYLQKAGYNPEGAIAFMRRMQGHIRKEPIRPMSYSRTHPHFDDRIRVIKQEVRGQVDFEDYINMTPETR